MIKISLTEHVSNEEYLENAYNEVIYITHHEKNFLRRIRKKKGMEMFHPQDRLKARWIEEIAQNIPLDVE